jgi:hypothetical protein
MARGNRHYDNLVKTVLEHSESSDWYSAVNEWSIVNVEEDDSMMESCICGKENLRYLFSIKNINNGNVLFPIGSSCIRKFGRSELNEEVVVKEQLFKLLHTIEDSRFLILSAEFFSRKLIQFLYEKGAFRPTVYNHYNPSEDYQFILDMFNKKTALTTSQDRKVAAIILNSIKPFLQEMLQDRIRKHFQEG